jgi:acetyl-CoA C-acetyltransferase
LSSVSAGKLTAHVIHAVVKRSGVDPDHIDDVVFAQGYANGEAPCIALWAALAAGLPVEVLGYQLDRRCGGGFRAVIDAAMMVQTGAVDLVIAGGVDSMSQVEFYSTDMRMGKRQGSTVLHDRLSRTREMAQPAERCGRISGMIETAENLARDYGISRQACDVFALSSQKKAASAKAAGKFAEEIAPVTVPQRKGDPILIDQDEGIRVDLTYRPAGGSETH